MKPGLGTTTAVEQRAAGVEAGRAVLTQNLDPDALARRIRFDEHMAATCGPVSAAFHAGRLAVLRGDEP